jgi:hypothetical protein
MMNSGTSQILLTLALLGFLLISTASAQSCVPTGPEIPDNIYDEDCDGWIDGSRYSIKSTRPRIFIDPQSVQVIAGRATGSHASEYSALKSRADELLSLAPSFQSGGYSVGFHDKVMVLTLVAVIEKENNNPNYVTYANRAFVYAQHILDTDPWDLTSKYVGISHHIRGRASSLSIVYDWLYDDLSPGLKGDIEDFLTNVYKGLHNIDRPSGSGQVRRSVYGSHYWLEWGSHPWYSLALMGEQGVDEAIVQQAVDDAYDEVHNYMVPVLDILGGALHNGWGYALAADQSFCFQNLLAWETATNDKIFTGSFALKDFPKFFVYASKPDGSLVKLDDTTDRYSDPAYPYGTLKWGVNDARSILIFPMDIYDDGLARYIVDKNPFRSAGQRMWRDLIFYDDSVAVKDPSALPLVEFFQGTGFLSGRSSWNADALFYTFRNRDQFGSHSDAKQNSFTIYYKGSPLAINDGNYPAGASSAPSTKSYYRRTVSSNSVLVFDPSETFYNYATVYNDGGQKFGSYDPVQGTGGYSPSYSCNAYSQAALDSSEYNTADNSFEDNPDFTWIRGDASRGYSSKLSHFDREFVHLKNTNIFVVFDRVESTDPGFKKKWLLHSLTEPILDGNEDFSCSQATGESRCQGDSNAGISKSYDSGYARIANGESELHSRTLYPTDHVYRKIGGSGYEFWIDDADQNLPPSSYTPSVTGGWRVEISPSASRQYDNFLHVLYATDPGAGNIQSSLIDNGNVIGAFINNSYAVVFARGKQPVDQAQYTLNGTGNVRNLIFGMKPDTSYNIYDNGQKILSVNSNENGIFQFDVVLSSPHTIMISEGPPQCHLADIGCSGCVDMNEIVLFIGDWEQGLRAITMIEIMDGIGLYKAGQGCP